VPYIQDAITINTDNVVRTTTGKVISTGRWTIKDKEHCIFLKGLGAYAKE
jgi:hypothetical protein